MLSSVLVCFFICQQNYAKTTQSLFIVEKGGTWAMETCGNL